MKKNLLIALLALAVLGAQNLLVTHALEHTEATAHIALHDDHHDHEQEKDCFLCFSSLTQNAYLTTDSFEPLSLQKAEAQSVAYQKDFVTTLSRSTLSIRAPPILLI